MSRRIDECSKKNEELFFILFEVCFFHESIDLGGSLDIIHFSF